MFCKNCGNKLSDNAKFCGECGNTVNFKTSEENYPRPKHIVGKKLGWIFLICAASIIIGIYTADWFGFGGVVVSIFIITSVWKNRNNKKILVKLALTLVCFSLFGYWTAPQYESISTVLFWGGVTACYLAYKEKGMKRNSQKTHESKKDHGNTTEHRKTEPDIDIKGLYRSLLHKYHPDFARSDEDKKFRTELTAKINRAYQTGDTHTLKLFM